jgi:hypothetical protein
MSRSIGLSARLAAILKEGRMKYRYEYSRLMTMPYCGKALLRSSGTNRTWSW